MSKAIAFSIITLLVTTTLLTKFVWSPTCGDGWKSSSIGKRGACSHHGGVSRSPFPVLVGIVSALGIYFILSKKKSSSGPGNIIGRRSAYGTRKEREQQLRSLGIDEKQIDIELKKTK